LLGFGSDPVLQAFGGALSIEGIQSTGVIATIKHLIANEQEMFRMYNIFQAGISSNVDDRTLHELYLWPFAEGVRSGVGAVMVAYNAVRVRCFYCLHRLIPLGERVCLLSE
jgi:beta-glucosidase-like glycosyl hydrolase